MFDHSTLDPSNDVPLVQRILRWLVPDRRRSPRQILPPLVAYLGLVGSSRPFPVGDVSATGFFMLTGEHWLPGTSMPVSLLRTDIARQARTEFITVQAVVVRNAPNGVGFAFLLADESAPSTDGLLGARWVSRKMMADFLDGLLHAESTEAHGLPCAS